MALKFDGTAGERFNRITGPDGDAYTLTFWGIIDTDRDANSVFFATQQDSGFDYQGLQTDSTGTQLVLFSAGGTTNLLSPGVGTWCFYVIRANGATIEAMAATGTNSLTTISRSNTLTVINDMSFGDNQFSEPLNGRIAAIKLWGDVRTDEQIALERWTYVPQNPDSLWGWWPCIDSTNTGCAQNLTFSTLSLTVQGTPPSPSDGPPISWGADVYIPFVASNLSITLDNGTLEFVPSDFTLTLNIEIDGATAEIAPQTLDLGSLGASIDYVELLFSPQDFTVGITSIDPMEYIGRRTQIGPGNIGKVSSKVGKPKIYPDFSWPTRK